MEFSLSKFDGSIPRLADHLLTKGTAAKALDCRLETGQLDSWREPLLVGTVNDSNTLVMCAPCEFTSGSNCVDWTTPAGKCARSFQSYLDGSRPTTKLRSSGCDDETFYLGVPCPTTAPDIFVLPGGDRDDENYDKSKESQSYAYQYVNVFGEAGSISPGSAPYVVGDGDAITVAGWPVPDTRWGVTHVRIYRSVSGHETGNEEGNTFNTTWMMMATVPVDDGSFNTQVANEDMIEALEEGFSPPPPDRLKGITLIEAQNVLAGYTGRRVWFSESGSFHSWPHYLELDDTVRGIAESNGILYVATAGRPYAITALSNCEGAGCREAIRLPGNYPMVGSGNRSMAKIRSGAVYPTHDGLVLLAGKNAPTLLTWQLYTAGQWQLLQPHTAVPVEHGGKLFVFMRGGSFVIKSPQSAEAGWETDFHSELSDVDVVDAYATPAGDLYLLRESGEIVLWDRGQDLRPHTWVSGEFVLPTDRAIGAGRMHHEYGSENLKVTVDGRTVLDRQVLSSRVFRLPMHAIGSRWRLELNGTSRVSLVSLATAMQDLGI